MEKCRRIVYHLFIKKVTIAKWHLNLFGVACITIGLIAGSYLTLKGIVSIFAANDTVKTWSINNTTASDFTAYGGINFGASGATITNQLANAGFESGTTSWSPFSQASSTVVGNGADGAITISTSKTIDTTAIANGRSAADAINYAITVNLTAGTTSTTISGDQTTSLTTGDEILFINLQGTSGDYSNVGKYETQTLSAVSYSSITALTTLTFPALTNGYDGTTQKIMIQRVPHYTNVTIQSGGTLTVSAWNGTKGGVLFFRANGTVDVQSGGTITTAMKGFRGGACKAVGIATNQGESINGAGGVSTSSNIGGGGGVPSSGGDGAGGAGGSYGVSGTNGTQGAQAGTVYGSAPIGSLFLGSGGGGGRGNGSSSTCQFFGRTTNDAGYGGGAIFIGTNVFSLTGTVSANGGNYAAMGWPGGDGAGGAGSGGSVYVIGTTVTLGSALTTGTGGLGGSGYGNNGKAGGSGRIRIDGVSTGTTNPTYYGASYTQTSAIAYAGTYSMKVIAAASDTAYLTQSFNIGDTNTYQLTAYVYDGTAGNVGGTVSSSVSELYYNGSVVSTTYTNVGSGWWRLDGTVTGANASRIYGLSIPAGKTVYVDSVVFPSRTVFNVTTAHGDGLVSSFDSFCEGTISSGTCTTTSTKPTGTGIYYQICTDDVATCNSGNTWQYWTGSAWANSSNLTSHRNIATDLTPTVMQALSVTNHKIAVRAILETTNESVPILPSVAVGYTTDTTTPTTNASGIAMTRSSGGTSVSSNNWTKNSSPYFSWTAGADNSGGSGVKGYCLYLGTDSNGNPSTSKGLLGTSPVSTTGTTCQFIVSGTSIDFATSSYKGDTWLTTSNNPYYLNVKVIDNASNIFASSSTQFQFRFDGTSPTNVSYTSCASGNFSNVVDMSFNWPTSSDSNSDVLGWQYQINSTSGAWQGLSSSSLLNLDYIPATASAYTLVQNRDGSSINSGTNVIYFRTVDNAGNTSADSTIRTCNISYGGAAPSFGSTDAVTVTPSTATSNSYALSWPVATPSGSNTITNYYYMLNTSPPSTLATLQGNSSTYIDNGTSRTVSTAALPNVNKGSNTVYVVAIDNASTPNYSPSNYITGTFTLNSTDPDNVGNLVSSDSSIKSSSQWNVTLTWTAPSYQGAGNLTYLVKRSTDNSTFTQVGTTSGLSYVDNTPSSALYYYKVYTKDGANAQSSGTNAISITPTGKWTSAPSLDSGPTAGSLTTKKATITWSTSRTSDSKIQYGTTSGSYGTVEPSNSSQVSAHSIQLTGLNPGTMYYYKAKWTDEDGNTGTSDEKSFTTVSAPITKEATAKTIGLTSAIIQFTSSNASKVKIYYGTSTSFGGSKETSTSTSETTYTSELTGLLDGTKYYYKINTFDADGSEYEGNIYSFETLPRPKISNVRLQQVANTAQSTILVTWTTNTEVSSIITYYPEGKTGEARDEVSVTLTKGDHRMIVRGLLPQTDYLMVVKGRDKIGNEASSDSQRLTTATDTRSPQISELHVEGSNIPQVTQTAQEQTAQLIVSWNTDEPATSQVEFGEGTGTSYSQKTQEDSNLTFNHIVIISNLTPSKVYHLRSISKDKVGNVGNSIDTVTITPKATENALNLVITNLQGAFGFLGGMKK